MKVQEYIREDGSNPYEQWFNSLDPQAAAKVAVAKARLELGNTSNIKWFDESENIELIGAQATESILLKRANSLLSYLEVELKKDNNPILTKLKSFIKSTNSEKRGDYCDIN